MCVSYPATLRLMDKVSTMHSAPLKQWIGDKEVVFKFWGDNVDKKRKVRDFRIDNQGEMLHMFSILVGRSRMPAPQFPHVGQLSKVTEVPSEFFLPSKDDVSKIKANLVILVSRVLTQYVADLVPLAKVVPKHILHNYSKETSQKSDVYILDVLMKNEVVQKDMIDIMMTLQNYLGSEHDSTHKIASGGDHVTCERQIGSQRHLMCGNTLWERLELLEPVVEDWHCLQCLLTVSALYTYMYMYTFSTVY